MTHLLHIMRKTTNVSFTVTLCRPCSSVQWGNPAVSLALLSATVHRRKSELGSSVVPVASRGRLRWNSQLNRHLKNSPFAFRVQIRRPRACCSQNFVPATLKSTCSLALVHISDSFNTQRSVNEKISTCLLDLQYLFRDRECVFLSQPSFSLL